MCGISGYFGNKKISKQEIDKTLELMKNRGPDFSNFVQIQKGGKNIVLLHSRLSIIDINDRSNQPFTDGQNIIIFNGEIYNYLELRRKLVEKGEKFFTDSDTEVLLKYYKIYGENCVDHFEGMWAFAVYNKNENKIFLSRDRFAEKPLYYHEDENGIFFGSETRFIKSLSKKKFEINYNHLNNFISLGYKSLFKVEETFFKDILYLKNSENLSCNHKMDLKKRNYWSPKISKIKKITLVDAILETKRLLKQSLRIRLRSDVPVAVCLSGGIDSSGLASIIAKDFNYKTKTFSIIDEDDRYNETENIKKTLDDIKCENIIISLKKKNFLKNLQSQIEYHNAPVATISYHAHSLLAKSINENGYKVAISGTAADEIYTGYYDHYLQHLQFCKNHKSYASNLQNYEKYIKPLIRNPIFKNSDLYINNPKYRDHIYDGRAEIAKYMLFKNKNDFFEENYHEDLLTNRRLNELFKENTPLILNQEDLNCMKYSVENRSPFLDTNLFKFIFSIPNEFLIKDGFSKYLLRESLNGILNDSVRLDRRKKGFNASINTLVNFKDKETLEFLLDKKSDIFHLVNINEIKKIFTNNEIPNYLSKFLFSFISSKIFLDTNDNLF